MGPLFTMVQSNRNSFGLVDAACPVSYSVARWLFYTKLSKCKVGFAGGLARAANEAKARRQKTC